MPRNLTILYGSQTGCAQDLAEHIWRESKKYHCSGRVLSMDAYNVTSLISEHIVVLVCSTTGQGNEPDNMKSFWKFLLRRSLPSDSLCVLNYAVLGMGDSSYAQFNFVAKRLNKRLQQLGGTPIIPLGLCDDQHDLGASAVYMPWLTSLWNELLQLQPMPNGLVVLKESPRMFRWNVQVCAANDAQDEGADIYENHVDAIFDETTFTASVISNARTTADEHFQDVRLISFNSNGIVWAPGDVLVVRPQNSDAQVDELFRILDEHNLALRADTAVRITEIDSELPVPNFLHQKTLKLRTISKQLWDLSSVPRPRTFELLAINCRNELEKEKLLEFTQPQGQEDLYAYANRPRRTILEVLRDFPHSTGQLTLPILFELFQCIKTRSFSIASCHQSGRLDVLVAVVEYKTMLSTKRKGLCSNWLKSLSVGNTIRGVIKKGTFKFPKDDSTPLIMVGPGTGLAPFRSLLMEKRLRWDTSAEPMCTLFFGCRGEKLDFHCKDDLREMESINMLRLITAFSRDQADKIYVQHRIEEYASIVRELLLERHGVFLVAGNSKNMPTAVKEAVVNALTGDSNYVEQMIKTGRYQEETWA